MLQDFAVWLFSEVLGTPLFAAVVGVSISVFTATAFLLRNVDPLRVLLAQRLAPKESVFKKYLVLLGYALDNLKLIFFASKTDPAPRRSYLQIYGAFLAFALGYTVVLFFVGWTFGGAGALGNVSLLPGYSGVGRLLVAAGFVLFGILVWTSVNRPETSLKFLDAVERPLRVPGVARVLLGVVGGLAVFGVQYLQADRTFGLDGRYITLLQGLLGLFAFLAIAGNSWSSPRPLIGFSFATTACYGYATGIPILVGVPLTVAIAAVLAGTGPVYASTVAVPIVMFAFYYLAPPVLQHTEAASVFLAALGSLPILFAVFSASWVRASAPRAGLYAMLAFVPVWLPSSISTAQSNDAIAFAAMAFWFVLPSLNALWDSVSWFLTWRLLSSLRTTLADIESGEAEAHGLAARLFALVRRYTVLLVHVAANLLVSGFLFFVTFLCVIVVVQLLNLAAKPVRPDYVFDLAPILEAVRTAPFKGDGLWVVMMLGMTLLPAMVHLIVVMMSGLIAAVGSDSLHRAWSVLSLPREDVKAADFDRAVTTVALSTATQFFFASTLLLVAASLYSRYASGYTLGEILSALGHAGLQMAGKMGLR